MLLVSIAGAVIPILIYLYFLRILDKNEPEPIKIVVVHFIYGATLSVILGILGSKVLSIPLNLLTNGDTSNILKIILIAPLVEEVAKASLLFKTINKKYVDNLTDGLVYGGAIGLGFGMTENFLYFYLFSESLNMLIPIFIMRTFFSAVMHGLATATVGGMMSLAKFSTPFRKSMAAILGLLLAMFIHFIWNFSVSYSDTIFIGISFMLFILIVFVLVYYFSLKFENKIISNELKNEIPQHLLSFITSSKKTKNEWFVHPYQKEFKQKAILLAFRKHEVDISDKNRELYEQEIEELRLEISQLLNIYNSAKLN